MKLVVNRSLFAAGGLGGVTHFLYAQQTRKVRGILASDIAGKPANWLVGAKCFYTKHDIPESQHTHS